MNIPDIPAERRVIAFVNYDYWYLSNIQAFGRPPDLYTWKKDLDNRFDSQDIYFYAPFPSMRIRKELPKIRAVTNKLIETWNHPLADDKEMTDRIMLDHCFQASRSAGMPNTLLLVTKANIIQPLVSYLKQQKKTVIIQGVHRHMNPCLCETATQIQELPPMYAR